MRRSAAVLALFVVALAALVGRAGTSEGASLAVAAKAVDFFAANQQTDGGFEVAGFPGFETPDAVLAIAAAGQSDDSWSTSEGRATVEAIATAGGLTGLDALDDLADAGVDAGQAAKLIVLDAVALGINPHDFDPSDDSAAPVDLVSIFKAGAAPDGTFGAFNATLYAALAYRVLGASVPAPTIAAIVNAQQANGGWNFAGDPAGSDDDPDTTGLAVQALVAGGRTVGDAAVAAGLAELAQTQQSDGSWQAFGASNPNSTAVAVLAVAAAGFDPSGTCWRDVVVPELAGAPYGDPDDYLRGLQAADGHLASPNDTFGVNTFGTSQGVEALLRRWVPVRTAAAPVCEPVPPTTPTSGGSSTSTGDTIPPTGTSPHLGEETALAAALVVVGFVLVAASAAALRRSVRAGIVVVAALLGALSLPSRVAPAAATPASTRAAADHVAAVVVDTGTQVKTSCVHFSTDSITGKQALEMAGVSPVFATYGSQGTAVCALCGTGCPSTNCLTCDAKNYWAYWRAAAGSGAYSYSSGGAGSTTVHDGDVEGWHWGSGSPPPFFSIEQVCGGAATTTTAGTPSSSSTTALTSTTGGAPSASSTTPSSAVSVGESTTTASAGSPATDELAATGDGPQAATPGRAESESDSGSSGLRSATAFAIALGLLALWTVRVRRRRRREEPNSA